MERNQLVARCYSQSDFYTVVREQYNKGYSSGRECGIREANAGNNIQIQTQDQATQTPDTSVFQRSTQASSQAADRDYSQSDLDSAVITNYINGYSSGYFQGVREARTLPAIQKHDNCTQITNFQSLADSLIERYLSKSN